MSITEQTFDRWRENARKRRRVERAEAKRRKCPTDITEAVGYLLSSPCDSETELSLDVQRGRVAAYCQAKGWDLVSVYQDTGQDADTRERPGLKSAISQLRPNRILLAYKLDRLSRVNPDMHDIMDDVALAGSNWTTIEGQYDSSTAMGAFVVHILCATLNLQKELAEEQKEAA